MISFNFMVKSTPMKLGHHYQAVPQTSQPQEHTAKI